MKYTFQYAQRRFTALSLVLCIVSSILCVPHAFAQSELTKIEKDKDLCLQILSREVRHITDTSLFAYTGYTKFKANSNRRIFSIDYDPFLGLDFSLGLIRQEQVTLGSAAPFEKGYRHPILRQPPQEYPGVEREKALNIFTVLDTETGREDHSWCSYEVLTPSGGKHKTLEDAPKTVPIASLPEDFSWEEKTWEDKESYIIADYKYPIHERDTGDISFLLRKIYIFPASSSGIYRPDRFIPFLEDSFEQARIKRSSITNYTYEEIPKTAGRLTRSGAYTKVSDIITTDSQFATPVHDAANFLYKDNQSIAQYILGPVRTETTEQDNERLRYEYGFTQKEPDMPRRGHFFVLPEENVWTSEAYMKACFGAVGYESYLERLESLNKKYSLEEMAHPSTYHSNYLADRWRMEGQYRPQMGQCSEGALLPFDRIAAFVQAPSQEIIHDEDADEPSRRRGLQRSLSPEEKEEGMKRIREDIDATVPIVSSQRKPIPTPDEDSHNLLNSREGLYVLGEVLLFVFVIWLLGVIFRRDKE